MKLIWHGLNDNYGHTKEEIKPQVDKYTLENNIEYYCSWLKVDL